MCCVSAVVAGVLSGRTVMTRPTRTSGGRSSPRGGRSSIAFPPRLKAGVLPCREAAAFLAQVKKAGPSRSPAALGPCRLRADRPRALFCHRGRDRRGSSKQTGIIMAIIGTSTASGDGYIGSIKTLALNIKAKSVASQNDHEKAPDYPILAGSTDYAERHIMSSRRGLEEDRPRQRSGISLGQARRSELPGADLRLAGQDRRRRRSYADLVASQR